MSPEHKKAMRAAQVYATGGMLPGVDPKKVCLTLLDAICATQAELALAKVDAELYRHLRSLNWTDNTLCVVTRPAENVKLGSYCPSGDRLDSELRAAIAASKP